MSDKTLTCKDCSNEFIFSEGEQEFYKEKGFENEPQRCPDCRKARKQARRNFNSSAGRDFGKGKSFGANRGMSSRW
jgi:NAD-dependent SIR2 family protein deacetylase